MKHTRHTLGAVFETPWTRRLHRDFREMEELRKASSILEFKPIGGDPPSKYLVTFKGRGLVKEPKGEVGFTDHHQAEIQMTLEYPRIAPSLRWLTPIHHPNIWGAGTVCLREYWSPLRSRLVDLVRILWDMARLEILNPSSAYTGGVDARAEWKDLERRFGPFPVDPRPIDDLAPKLPEEPDEGEADIVIGDARRGPPPDVEPFSFSGQIGTLPVMTRRALRMPFDSVFWITVCLHADDRECGRAREIWAREAPMFFVGSADITDIDWPTVYNLLVEQELGERRVPTFIDRSGAFGWYDVGGNPRFGEIQGLYPLMDLATLRESTG